MELQLNQEQVYTFAKNCLKPQCSRRRVAPISTDASLSGSLESSPSKRQKCLKRGLDERTVCNRSQKRVCARQKRWWHNLRRFDGEAVICRQLSGTFHFQEDAWFIGCSDGESISGTSFEQRAGSKAKKPCQSIRFVSSGLSLQAVANARKLCRSKQKTVGTSCVRTDEAASRAWVVAEVRILTPCGAVNDCCLCVQWREIALRSMRNVPIKVLESTASLALLADFVAVRCNRCSIVY